jgi:hypothetical protein
MSESSAILHSLSGCVDWDALALSPSSDAAHVLKSILVSLDTLEEKVYFIRGRAAIMVEQRQLYEQFTDPEVDKPFASFDRWVKWACPKSWGYVRDAMRVIKKLPNLSPVDMESIGRSNLLALGTISEGLKSDPKVIDAAKKLKTRDFVKKMNADYNQHIEQSEAMVFPVTTSQRDAIEAVLDFVGEKMSIDDRSGQLEALAEDWRQEHMQ